MISDYKVMPLTILLVVIAKYDCFAVKQLYLCRHFYS